MKYIDTSLTNYCPYHCPNCVNARWQCKDKNKALYVPTPAFIDLLKSEKPDMVTLSGGQPTEHPDYDFILNATQMFTKVVVQYYDKRHWAWFPQLGKTFFIELVPNGKYFCDMENKKITLPELGASTPFAETDFEVSDEFLADFDYFVVAPDKLTDNGMCMETCWHNAGERETGAPSFPKMCRKHCLPIKVAEDYWQIFQKEEQWKRLQ